MVSKNNVLFGTGLILTILGCTITFSNPSLKNDIVLSKVLIENGIKAMIYAKKSEGKVLK